MRALNIWIAIQVEEQVLAIWCLWWNKYEINVHSRGNQSVFSRHFWADIKDGDSKWGAQHEALAGIIEQRQA